MGVVSLGVNSEHFVGATMFESKQRAFHGRNKVYEATVTTSEGQQCLGVNCEHFVGATTNASERREPRGQQFRNK